jgi:TPR repeat protein
MKGKTIIGSLLLAGTATLWSQLSPATRNTFVEGFGDLGKIRLEAERGNVGAQIKLADAYLSHLRSADALKWYAAAAEQKSLEGEYQAGRLLLFGRVGIPEDQKVTAKPTEGLRWTYMAATGGHHGAWRDMAQALKSGVGCSTNIVEAYAWLGLLAETGDVVGKVEMNNLALKLASDEILRGKSLAREMKEGHWPPLPARRVDVTLKLTGVIVSPKGKQAVINNHSMSEGETLHFFAGKQQIAVTCKSIQADSVQVQVEGEDNPRMLTQASR